MAKIKITVERTEGYCNPDMGVEHLFCPDPKKRVIYRLEMVDDYYRLHSWE